MLIDYYFIYILFIYIKYIGLDSKYFFCRQRTYLHKGVNSMDAHFSGSPTKICPSGFDTPQVPLKYHAERNGTDQGSKKGRTANIISLMCVNEKAFPLQKKYIKYHLVFYQIIYNSFHNILIQPKQQKPHQKM